MPEGAAYAPEIAKTDDRAGDRAGGGVIHSHGDDPNRSGDQSRRFNVMRLPLISQASVSWRVFPLSPGES